MTKAGARDNASTGDDSTQYYSTFAKEDLETILGALRRHVPEPRVLAKRTSRPRRARSSANTTRTAPSRCRSCSRCSAIAFYQAHTYKHTTMGFIARHREHAERVRVLEGVLRALVPPAVHDGHHRRRRDAGRVLPLVEKYWGGWKARRGDADDDPAGAAAERARIRARAVDERHAAVGDRRLSRAGVRRERARTRRRWRCSARLYFGQTSDLYKKLVVSRAEGRSNSWSTCRRASTRRCSRCSRA